MTFVDFDVVELAEIIVSSSPEHDPVRFSAQWPGSVWRNGRSVDVRRLEDGDIVLMISGYHNAVTVSIAHIS